MNADVRTGGRWGPLQRLKNAALRVVIRAALALADRLPASLLVLLGRGLGLLAWCCCRKLGRTARHNVERAGLALGPGRLVKRSFVRAGENLGLCLLLRRPSFRASDCVTVDEPARALLAEVHAAGGGVLFVSAHLGPFELLASVIAELGYRPAVVVRESYDPALDREVDRHRHGRQIEVIHRGHPHAMTRVLRALRAGRPVGVLPDLGGRVRCLDTEFLGGRVDFPVGPARIALRSGANLVVGTLARDASRASRLPRFRLRIVNVPTSGSEPGLTRRIATELGNAVAGNPEDWLWMGARIRTLQENRTNG